MANRGRRWGECREMVARVVILWGMGIRLLVLGVMANGRPSCTTQLGPVALVTPFIAWAPPCTRA
jgi:hypothetical protein